ncbi:MAG TPA: hypothetical protein VFQ53_14030 [Kofleriaceae bacterium]|nr:hypothetical protein [Kofleriaceae bacterium]
MRRLALLVLLLPIVRTPAFADDAPPGDTPEAPATVDDHPCHAHRWHTGPMRERFAIGFAKGHVEGEDADGSTRSLVGRVGLHRHLELEVELARTELADDTLKTGGGALVHAFGRRHVRPYVLAGAGGGELDRADGSDARVHYGELGVGLQLRGRRLAIGFDVRRGVRAVDDTEPTMTTARMMTPPDDHEHYTRGRLLALVYF